MAYLYTSEISEEECIGDSLDTKINPNFLNLDNAVQGLSGTIDSFKTGGDLFLADTFGAKIRLSVRRGSNSEGFNIVIGGGGQNTVGEAGATYKGSYNVGLGRLVLQSNTTGYSNTGLGHGALYLNTTGYANTATGTSALQNNTTGTVNAAFGHGALYTNSTGYYNNAFGYGALFLNTTGLANAAFGGSALYNNTTGIYNTAVGHVALYTNSTGNYNTAIGDQALYLNTTGGDNNTAVGALALNNNTSGAQNIAIGVSAGFRDLTSNGSNGNTTGTNNIFIGYCSVGTSASVSNKITLGNSSHDTLRCQATTITALSDRRDKKDIKPIPAGLDFINRLTPVSFLWNMRDGGVVDKPEFGFIAQDLQDVQNETGITVPKLVYDDNPERLEASPGTLIPVLVKAIQELSAELKELKSQLQK